jgi:hypothetical protein
VSVPDMVEASPARRAACYSDGASAFSEPLR